MPDYARDTPAIQSIATGYFKSSVSGPARRERPTTQIILKIAVSQTSGGKLRNDRHTYKTLSTMQGIATP